MTTTTEGDSPSGTASPAASAVETLPLTHAQAGLWYAQQLQPDNPVFGIGQYLRVDGAVSAQHYRRAAATVVAETEVLRARFEQGADGPVQVVTAQRDWEFNLVDVSGEADPAAAALAWMRRDMARPADPAVDPLLSVAVITAGERLSFCYQRVHHLALDGYGASLLVSRIVQLYTAFAEGRAAPANSFGRLRELVADDTEYRSSAKFRAGTEFWSGRLGDRPDPTLLAGQPTELPHRLLRTSAEISGEVAAALRGAARDAGVGLSPLLIAATAAYLSRCTGDDDVLLGLPVTGRSGRVAKRVPGMVSNVLPLRVRVRPESRVREVATEVSAEIRQVLRHQRHHPDDIRRELGLGLDARLAGPSVNILPPAGDITLAGLPATLHNLSVGPVDDLSIVVSEATGGALRIDIDANPELYGEADLTGHRDRFEKVLLGIAADVDTAVGALDVATDADRGTLGDGEDSLSPARCTVTIADLFANQVLRSPGATALVTDGFEVSFAELDRLTNRAARELISRGVAPGKTVGVAMPRCADLIISLLAVVKAGGVYVPIDPGYPDERIEYMIEDSRPSLVLADQATVTRLPASTPVLLVDEQAQVDRLAEHTDEPISPRRADPADPAYVIYTSGSTGRPKGVVVEHASLANLFAYHHAEVFGPAVALVGGRRLRVAHISPVSFDASWDPLLWMLDGHQLHFIDDDTRRDPEALVSCLHAAGVDSIETTPTYAAQLIEAGLLDRAEDGSCLRVVLLGGEAVDEGLWRRLADAPGVLAFNLFGPAEVTVDSVVARVDRHPRPVIGHPVGNTRAYVLDSGLQPMPAGRVGELYLAGAGLARAYLHQPVRTGERFVPNPYGPPGSRMYRTGDLARWTDDGVLEFAGRGDRQVKLRGFRVELGEVDAVLGEHPDVTETASVIRSGAENVGQLVTYVVPCPGCPIEAGALREYAARRLPGHMVPAVFVELDALPLSANGKLDESALPDPVIAGAVGAATRGRAPRTLAEELLAGLFAQALGLPEVGVEDDFFDLGGHSLIATRLISRIRNTFGADLPIRAVFEAPTVAGLAERLDAGLPGRPPLRPMPRPEPLPLSAAQRRLWFLNQLDTTSGAYDIPAVVRLRGDLDIHALRGALADLVDRHETLRTVFPAQDGEPRQHVLDPPGTSGAGFAGLRVVPVTADTLSDRIQEVTGRGFDVTTDLPVRATLLKLGEQDHVLCLVLHHIAADGWSLAPLARDVTRCYAARARGANPRLAPLPVQYADYTLWDSELLGAEDDPDSTISRQLGYWAGQLAGLPEELELPVDRARGRTASDAGGAVELALPAEVRERLTTLARVHDASVFMVLQAALAALLTRLGAGTDIPLGTPIAGRTDESLDELVGFFVNTLVLRTDTAGDPSFTELIARVRETDLQAYSHQDVPFERVVEHLSPPRSLARHPLFQVMLSFQNAPRPELDLPGLDATVEPAGAATGAKFDLNLDLHEYPGDARIDGVLNYNAELFDRDTATELAARFVRLVTELTAAPDRPIGRARLLDDAERHRMLTDVASGGPGTGDATVLDAFAAQVAATPQDTAVTDDAGSLSFAELAARAYGLAHDLIERGATGRPVAVALPRSTDSVVALLGVLQAGAIYLPIELTYPAGRIEQIVADARPACAITDPATAPPLPPGLDTLHRLGGRSATAPRVELRPADTAYLLFTSGSTGRPKGVRVPHGALANLLGHHRRAYYEPARQRLGRPLRVAHTTAMSFDASWDPLLWLLAGHRLRMVDDDIRRDPEALVALIRAEHLDVVQTTPSYAAALLDGGLLDAPARPSVLTVGGEAIGPTLWERLRAADGLTALNLYGPTEATVDPVVADLAGHDRPVLGRPIAGMSAYVLDRRLEPLPVGATGELYLAGAGLAHGYTGQPTMTAERFVADPHGPAGTRMYRTGDLARWNRAGALEFRGRTDDQVKVRGFRIELGEVEAALLRHPDVARAAPLLDTEPTGAGRLIAYLVGKPGRTPDPGEVRSTAARWLPGYMVPTALAVLDELPLTVNGKLDRSALPAPEPTGNAASVAPRTPRQQLLAGLFAEVLGIEHGGIEQVGVEDSFFDLGGHSLLATKLISRIRTVLGVDLPIHALFEASTVAALADRLDDGDTGQPLGGLLPLRTRGDAPPLFAVHPASGLAWSFAGLLRYLPAAQPLYGLQVRGITAGDTVPADADELIEDYVARIRSVAPDGPYRLLGWSLGGAIAHRIAVRLQADGAEVQTLIMLDSRPVDAEHPVAVPDRAADGDESELFRTYLLDQFGITLDPDATADADTVREVLRREGSALAELDLRVLSAIARAFAHNTRLLGAGHTGVVHGDVEFVTATASSPDPSTPHRRWEPYCTGTVHDHPVDAVHGYLMSPDALASVGPVVAAALDRAEP